MYDAAIIVTPDVPGGTEHFHIRHYTHSDESMMTRLYASLEEVGIDVTKINIIQRMPNTGKFIILLRGNQLISAILLTNVEAANIGAETGAAINEAKKVYDVIALACYRL